MIPNITQGDRMAGLMVYLAGPGRANEHEEPHLVAGDSAFMACHDDDELNRDAALEIASALDRARQFFESEVDGGHVFHCSLSLAAEEGRLTDPQWAGIATDFMMEMDFTGESGKAPARWVAVRHGLSTNSNDHIHLVASMVRDDGTRWNPWKSKYKSQQAARTLEKVRPEPAGGSPGGAGIHPGRTSQGRPAGTAGGGMAQPRPPKLRGDWESTPESAASAVAEWNAAARNRRPVAGAGRRCSPRPSCGRSTPMTSVPSGKNRPPPRTMIMPPGHRPPAQPQPRSVLVTAYRTGTRTTGRRRTRTRQIGTAAPLPGTPGDGLAIGTGGHHDPAGRGVQK